MRGLKYLCVYLILLPALHSYAGAKLPVDATSGEVVYKQIYKLHTNFADDEVYALVQNWFNNNASRFTCQNAGGQNCSCKNKTVVEDEFKNQQPLQSLDPSSGRITARGVIKYFGGSTSSISLLYMEYYVVIQVSGHQLTATISKIKYHHYNQLTYTQKPIYLWGGGKPFDAADKLENLVNNATESKDLQDLGAFVNKNMSTLFSNLQSFLQTQNLVERSTTLVSQN